MRSSNGYYDDFDELDELGFDGVMAVRHTADNKLPQERRLEARKRRYAAGKGDWFARDWGSYDIDGDYRDYDTGDIDKSSELIIDND